ncbi:hypothetical protein BCR34DRAFT_555636 [Clohesyomyces aquaticus]|uniref:Uncharacterized protein n=1 Tax=Clohesyomyces aquaticus TaxID=1231657 RepID=A0A1Y2A3Y2_9PLEO|nr:hypothetical protein BCR34DRAFT_555636 [Clohesyomyces aquaticus]
MAGRSRSRTGRIDVIAPPISFFHATQVKARFGPAHTAHTTPTLVLRLTIPILSTLAFYSGFFSSANFPCRAPRAVPACDSCHTKLGAPPASTVELFPLGIERPPLLPICCLAPARRLQLPLGSPRLLLLLTACCFAPAATPDPAASRSFSPTRLLGRDSLQSSTAVSRSGHLNPRSCPPRQEHRHKGNPAGSRSRRCQRAHRRSLAVIYRHNVRPAEAQFVARTAV